MSYPNRATKLPLRQMRWADFDFTTIASRSQLALSESQLLIEVERHTKRFLVMLSLHKLETDSPHLKLIEA
ncbi:hypothetical protein RRG08_005484 [Elysia crispata]|uniref:Uncharacterized protein n=1 Tax=Elysia crispata TaxID=231223 RepID=A0AAE1CR82_9GAST|nr:hypothetical protein RRG08_005484 [Elysia crispata]